MRFKEKSVLSCAALERMDHQALQALLVHFDIFFCILPQNSLLRENHMTMAESLLDITELSGHPTKNIEYLFNSVLIHNKSHDKK